MRGDSGPVTGARLKFAIIPKQKYREGIARGYQK